MLSGPPSSGGSIIDTDIKQLASPETPERGHALTRTRTLFETAAGLRRNTANLSEHLLLSRIQTLYIAQYLSRSWREILLVKHFLFWLISR